MSRSSCASIAVLALALIAACTEAPTSVEPTKLPTRAQPLLVDAAGSFIQVAAGSFDGCGLRNDGAVECWGQNFPGGEVKVATTGTFVSVSLGAGQPCGLRTDGAVECWGPFPSPQIPTTPVVAAVGKFTSVSVGLMHACALRDDGVVECWGIDKYGQATPMKTASDGRFTALAAGYRHNCAVRDDGYVECWGLDGGGGAASPSTQPTVGKFKTVATNQSSNCALRDDGVVQCWGLNDVGNAPPVKEAAVGKFTAITGDPFGRRMCGLRTDGAVECWGFYRPGGPIPTKTAAVGKFTAVSTGGEHTCAVRTDGVIECWGLNEAGQAPPTRTAGLIKVRVNPTATLNAPASVVVGQSITVSLTNAAVPGHPEATAFSYAFDCGTGYQPATTIATSACASGAPGARTVKGKVIDKDGDVAEYTKTVTVLSASGAIAQLKTAIASASSVSSNLRTPLTVKLNAADAAIAKQKYDIACTALGDFESQVKEKRGAGIPIATADAWLETLGAIKAAVGCSGGC